MQEFCTTCGMPKYDSALVKVLKAAGGPTRVAEYLGVVPSAVTQWERVPSRHVPRLEALTGIPGRLIRPDLYKAPGTPRRKRSSPPIAGSEAAE